MSSHCGILRNAKLAAISLTLVFTQACYPAGGLIAQPPSALIAGTYQVSICEDPCVPGNPVASGLVVLTDRPIIVGTLPEAAGRYLERKTEGILVTLAEFGRETNACYAFEAGSGGAATAGATPAAVTGWRQADGGIVILVWASPDAGYDMKLLADGGNWKGRGYSWYSGKGYHATAETVTLTRIGPPDLGRCVQAIEEAASRRSPVASPK